MFLPFNELEWKTELYAPFLDHLVQDDRALRQAAMSVRMLESLRLIIQRLHQLGDMAVEDTDADAGAGIGMSSSGGSTSFGFGFGSGGATTGASISVGAGGRGRPRFMGMGGGGGEAGKGPKPFLVYAR